MPLPKGVSLKKSGTEGWYDVYDGATFVGHIEKHSPRCWIPWVREGDSNTVREHSSSYPTRARAAAIVLVKRALQQFHAEIEAINEEFNEEPAL